MGRQRLHQVDNGLVAEWPRGRSRIPLQESSQLDSVVPEVFLSSLFGAKYSIIDCVASDMHVVPGLANAKA